MFMIAQDYGIENNEYMPGVSCTLITSIFIHTHRAFISLIYYIVFYTIILCNHEHHEPYIVWDIFAHSYQLGFCGAIHVYLLFPIFSVYYSITHWCCSHCMFSHIIMHSINCIYPRVQVIECFCTDNSLIFYCILHVWRPLFNCFQSSTFLSVNFIFRKDRNVYRSGRLYFTLCKFFAVMLWNISVFVLV